MFDSGIKASELISQIQTEADIALPIEYGTYALWLSALEHLLYTEVIQEQGESELAGIEGDIIDIAALTVPESESSVRFEDIHAVYADSTQLIESTVASAVLFPNTYYKIGNNIGLNLQKKPETIKIIYFVKPKIKTPSNITETNVMVPIEFIDLVKAKLRGEAYKVANEGELAAMWLNDYNILLETFRSWVTAKNAEFGM